MPSPELTLTLRGVEETRRAGLALGRALPPRALILLSGEMGAGKTTLAKAICEALGVKPEIVISPTYTLVNVYPRTAAGTTGTVYHVDLYRMERTEALLELDRDDWIHPEGVTLMEWPDVARPLLADEAVLDVRLEDSGPDQRTMELTGDPAVYGAALEAMRSAT
ncbi:MAG TPA: tRNA (adenosine(37)-N6)-threonylcarbamoyltransferase complex ATPase subunit type 1 TsaE [Gemmatimonadaceae bacterium]